MTAQGDRPMRVNALLLVAIVILTACSSTSAIPPGFAAVPGPLPDGRPHVEMHYLGGGGWLFRRGADVIATAPFVSNPTWLALLRPAHSDEAMIDRHVPDMRDVEIVLVGHSHYDHAMDLPSIAARKAPSARFYGSRTLKHMLAPKISAERLESLEGKDAVGDRPGTWFYNRARTLRFMALRSTHAPHILGMKIVATGTLDHDLAELPGAPLTWKEGETLAFLIDFLGPTEEVEFRIYYQDAASRAGTGIVPVLGGRDAARTDVAVLCVAAFDQVPGNPEHILANVLPRSIVGGHWEDFVFRSFEEPLRPSFGTSLDDFLQRAQAVSAAKVYLPRPGDHLFFEIERPR